MALIDAFNDEGAVPQVDKLRGEIAQFTDARPADDDRTALILRRKRG